MENESLVLDLLEWIGATPRHYNDVMDAWRTSCPRLSIWEDTLDAGFLGISDQNVHLTPKGFDFLSARRKPDSIHAYIEH